MINREPGYRERGEGVGEEPTTTTARKPGPPYIIQYSLERPSLMSGRGSIVHRGRYTCRAASKSPH
jgi:hypothetical protein